MKNNYIIGIDGGGTNTKCILFDFEGKTIDCIDSSGSNLYVYKESGVKVITQILSKILDLMGTEFVNEKGAYIRFACKEVEDKKKEINT